MRESIILPRASLLHSYCTYDLPVSLPYARTLGVTFGGSSIRHDYLL